jgi:VanZ family protein
MPSSPSISPPISPASPARRWLWAWGPVGLWAVTVFGMSALPGSALPELPGKFTDKLIHGAVYAVLGALCWRAIRLTRRLSQLRVVVLAALVTTLYGITDEFHQAFVPRRSSDWWDVVSDALGGLIGATVCAILVARRRPKRGS